jgi:putative oxidoreductase
MKRADLLPSLGLLFARLGFGAYMMTHGWGKVQMLIARDWDKFGDPIKLGKPLSLTLATFAEFFCALLVVVGLATRLATVPVIITMLVAAFVVHASDPWTAGAGFKLFQEGERPFPRSKEPALLFLIGFLTLLLTGPGRFSIDAVLWPKLRSRRQRRAAAE